jgi:hypothetical protein
MEYISGISLGQANEFTSLAILERQALPRYSNYTRPLSNFSVRHLERFPIGTSYSAIFERVNALFAAKPLPGNSLVVDQTAVGEPVLQSLRRARTPGGFKRVSITNGLDANFESKIWQVPKKDLVGTLQVLLQDKRLKIVASLPDVPTLINELMNFQMKPAPPSADPLAAWREGPQDELVFAIGVAAWWVERALKTLWIR